MHQARHAVTVMELPAFGIFPDSCGWKLVAHVMLAPTIGLGVLEMGGKPEFDRYVQPFNTIDRHEPIEGLDDEAADVGAGSMLVLEGDTIFQLQHLALKDTDSEFATELASKALARLG